MSLNMNFVNFQKNDLMVKKVTTHNNGVNTNMNICCRAKELQMHSHKKNLYQVLSLESQSVSLGELKKAYRAKARQLHPDVFPSSKKEEYTKRFVELREAYEVLSDPKSRRMYDLSLVGEGGHVFNERKEHFSRMVWETQLEGLSQRSAIGRKRRNSRFV